MYTYAVLFLAGFPQRLQVMEMTAVVKKLAQQESPRRPDVENPIVRLELSPGGPGGVFGSVA